VASSDARKSSALRSKNRKWIRPLWITLLTLPCLALERPRSLPLTGLDFVVNTTEDSDDANPGDGICETVAGSGQCSLRAAIEEANAQPTDDTITFNIPKTGPGYNGTFWTINLVSALPDLSTNIDIQGLGVDLLTITRNSDNFFRIFTVTSTGTVSLSGLTISNGNFSSSGNGGGVDNESSGIANVTNCTLSSNIAERGGGISNNSTGTVNVTNSTVSGNTATDRGGGITNQGPGIVNVTSSTINGNRAIDGAGIRQAGLGTVNVTNCTITGNTAIGFSGGGGISNVSGGTFNFTNCTVTSNQGPGFLNTSGPFNVRSSIVAHNLNGDISGSFNSEGFNLIGVAYSSAGFTQPTDQTGTIELGLDPLLDPDGLKDNGGPTQTIALLPAGPAIDKGSREGLTGTLTTDQRGAGYPRIFDHAGIPNAIGGDGTDIGAFEVQLIPSVLVNISTRAYVETGDDVLIGGFIITGTGNKEVIVRALGPSLAGLNVTGALSDPTLELYDQTGTLLEINDDWKMFWNHTDLELTGLAPTDDKESAVLTTLAAGAYTAIVRGVNNGTGVALVEVYDLGRTLGSKLANISTRGLVQTGDNVMIGGFIITGDESQSILVRALGPSLPVSGTLANPTLTLHDSNGNVIASNDDWRSTQEAEIIATGIPPPNELESAILVTLQPASYTAIVSGVNNTTGLALVEVYTLD
jgi:CSLREA domain-containing protein